MISPLSPPEILLLPVVLIAVPDVVVLLLSIIVSLLIEEPETFPEVAPDTELDLLEVPVTGIVSDCLVFTDD